MASFFPNTTVTWRIQEPSAVRRLTLSVVTTAVVTGVAVRALRALALTQEPGESLAYWLGVLVVALGLFFGAATLHLGNYTLRRWVWRVPAFAAIEVAAEMATSAALIAAGVEPLGTTGRANVGDWPAMAVRTAVERFTALIVFALVLAGVVQVVRYALARRDARGGEA